uniref:Defensin beta 133 n=1 Tax=Neovison vison TaxID=452646 RepID=A0A8C7AD58_NEOVI
TKIPVLFPSSLSLSGLTDTRVKYARKDTYSCFFKRCKRHECHDFEKTVDFSTKVNAKWCK